MKDPPSSCLSISPSLLTQCLISRSGYGVALLLWVEATSARWSAPPSKPIGVPLHHVAAATFTERNLPWAHVHAHIHGHSQGHSQGNSRGKLPRATGTPTPTPTSTVSSITLPAEVLPAGKQYRSLGTLREWLSRALAGLKTLPYQNGMIADLRLLVMSLQGPFRSNGGMQLHRAAYAVREGGFAGLCCTECVVRARDSEQGGRGVSGCVYYAQRQKSRRKPAGLEALDGEVDPTSVKRNRYRGSVPTRRSNRNFFLHALCQLQHICSGPFQDCPGHTGMAQAVAELQGRSGMAYISLRAYVI